VMSWFAVACVCGLLSRRRASLCWLLAGLIGALVVRSKDWTTVPSPVRVITVALQLVGCVLKLPAAWIRRDLPGGAAVPLVIGVILTVALGLTTGLVLRSGQVHRRQVSGLLGLELYVVGFIAMVSSARSNPFYETPAQSRYSTVTLLGLLCLIALITHARSNLASPSASPASSSVFHRLVSPVGISVVACVVLIGVSVSAVPSLPGWRSSVKVIERCVAEFRPNVARQADCKYAWDTPLDEEWKALKKG
jgi:hypothetical protein